MYNSHYMTGLKKIIPGFGERLKGERKRLGLSQAALGQVAGIRRLAQIHYETETSTPTVRYLSQISEAGVDLTYLLFGIKSEYFEHFDADIRRIETEALKLTEEVVQSKYNGELSAEGRYIIFDLLRTQLVTSTQLSSISDMDYGTAKK